MADCSTEHSDSYFKRFGFCKRQILAPASSKLGIVVVIPCHDEPDIIAPLDSLRHCGRPSCAVEIIMVINSSEAAAPGILERNQTSFSQASRWSMDHSCPMFRTHILHASDLPEKLAGVGLARKIGMDEALRRLMDVGRPDGVIACLDADCACDPNYLTEIESCFVRDPNISGCSIYFEHPLEGSLVPDVYGGIALYELHLRYYVQALRHSGFPHAHHTVGSSMAIRADSYRKQGGMNKRKAGEDFYFLQKIFPLGTFVDLNATRVIPSPRPSHRVPFGTGKAVREFLETGFLPTYPLQAFLDLKSLFQRIPNFHAGKNPTDCPQQESLPESIVSFLAANNFESAVNEIRKNTASDSAFTKRFFGWFNGFQAMKFLHHARDTFYGPGYLRSDPAQLLARLQVDDPFTHRPQSTVELLSAFRELDRAGSPAGLQT